MLVVKILKEDVKLFMNKLLKESSFDLMEVRGIEIDSFTKFEINCIKNKNFFEDEIKEDEKNFTKFLLWEDIKNYITGILKGHTTPNSIKIIFAIPEIYLEKIHSNAGGLFLNMHFVDGQVNFVTGVSQKEFAMDKSVDVAWEEYVIKFFKKHEITISQ